MDFYIVIVVILMATALIDLIVGVSIGSIIGALYANGMSAADVEQLAMQLDLSALRDLSWLHWGQVRGQKLQDFVNARVRHLPLESLGVRFAVVDLHLLTHLIQ